jgi:hypothetical protein
MAHEDAQPLTVADLLALPPTTDVETAGRAFGLGRSLAYRLARSGQFPCEVIRAGGAFRVVTADLLRVLHITAPAAQGEAA